MNRQGQRNTFQQGIRHGQFFAVLDQTRHRLVEIRTRRLFQRRRFGHVQRLATGADQRRRRQPQRTLLEVHLDEFVERGCGRHVDFAHRTGADGTVFLLFVGKGVRVYAIAAHEHHVRVEVLRAKRQVLDGFVDAGGGNDGVGAGDSGDDVLLERKEERICKEGESEETREKQ